MIERLSRDFVPVALNLYRIRKEKSPAGDFFRDLQKQTPEQYQGIHVASPEGKVLSNQSRRPEGKSWTKDFLEVLDRGLNAYGKVTPRKAERRDLTPFRGIAVRDDGGIVLAAYTRATYRGTDPSGLSSVVFDSVELTASLAESLTIANSPTGTTWRVPPETVKRFHVLLTSSSDKSTLPRADEVTTATLKGKIERIEDGIAYLSFEGKLTGSHVGEFEPYEGKKTYSEMKLHGVGTCEAKKGRLLSFILIGEGTFRSFPPYDEPAPIGAVLEWASKKR